MTTYGKAKWEKYFSNREIETTVKKPSFLYDSNNQKIGQIDSNTKFTVLPKNDYRPKYEVKIGDQIAYVVERDVAKPRKDSGSTENLRVYASTLTQQGEVVVLNGTECRSFRCANVLANSIISGLSTNSNISNNIIETFERSFQCDTAFIPWEEDISKSDKKELGKYTGELLIGMQALQGGGFGNVQSFIIPETANFASIDSFIVNETETVAISSKFGEGAPSSIFPVLNRIPDNSTVLNDLYDPSMSPKKMIFEYGIRNILKLDGNTIANSYSVYRDLVSNNISDQVLIVADQIRLLTDDKLILEQLPNSITKFFSRQIAEAINADRIALQLIIDQLARAGVVKSSLAIEKWLGGLVDFNLSRASSSMVKIVAAKSAVGDPSSAHGLIQYQIINS